MSDRCAIGGYHTRGELHQLKAAGHSVPHQCGYHSEAGQAGEVRILCDSVTRVAAEPPEINNVLELIAQGVEEHGNQVGTSGL